MVPSQFTFIAVKLNRKGEKRKPLKVKLSMYMLKHNQMYDTEENSIYESIKIWD